MTIPIITPPTRNRRCKSFRRALAAPFAGSVQLYCLLASASGVWGLATRGRQKPVPKPRNPEPRKPYSKTRNTKIHTLGRSSPSRDFWSCVAPTAMSFSTCRIPSASGQPHHAQNTNGAASVDERSRTMPSSGRNVLSSKDAPALPLQVGREACGLTGLTIESGCCCYWWRCSWSRC